MKNKTLLAVGLAATFGYAGSASANIIDLFSDPPNTDPEYPQQVSLSGISVNAGDVAWNQNTTPYPDTIIGAYRDIILTAESDFTSAGNNAFLTASDGILDLATSPSITASATVQWDGNDNSPLLDLQGLGGINLIDQIGCGAGCAAFLASVAFADFDFPYSITVYDMTGAFSVLSAASQFSVGTPPQQDVAGPVAVDYLFDWFNLATGNYTIAGLTFNINRPGGLVDFTNIGALQLDINKVGGLTAQKISVDLQLGAIRKVPVPEPGILGLMGLGGLMAGLLRRRNKAKALTA